MSNVDKLTRLKKLLTDFGLVNDDMDKVHGLDSTVQIQLKAGFATFRTWKRG